MLWSDVGGSTCEGHRLIRTSPFASVPATRLRQRPLAAYTALHALHWTRRRPARDLQGRQHLDRISSPDVASALCPFTRRTPPANMAAVSRTSSEAPSARTYRRPGSATKDLQRTLLNIRAYEPAFFKASLDTAALLAKYIDPPRRAYHLHQLFASVRSSSRASSRPPVRTQLCFSAHGSNPSALVCLCTMCHPDRLAAFARPPRARARR